MLDSASWSYLCLCFSIRLSSAL